MQTLMIFWSSWRLEMIISERQQDPTNCPLLVPSKVGQIRLLIRKSLWLVPYLSYHSLKQRDSSISLNKSVSIPLLNYLTPSWVFSYLLVLGCWMSERCIEWYLLVHRSAIHLEILFERILKTWQSSQDNSLEALILYFLTRAVSAFDLLYYYKPLWSSR